MTGERGSAIINEERKLIMIGAVDLS